MPPVQCLQRLRVPGGGVVGRQPLVILPFAHRHILSVVSGPESVAGLNFIFQGRSKPSLFYSLSRVTLGVELLRASRRFRVQNDVKDGPTKGMIFMKAFAKMSALFGLVAVFGTTALAQAPAPPAPPTAAAPKMGGTAVKGYTRKTKSGKMVTVKGYTRKPTTAMMAPKMTAVKGYTRTTKSGKMVTVKGYTRKAAPKTPAPKM